METRRVMEQTTGWQVRVHRRLTLTAAMVLLTWLGTAGGETADANPSRSSTIGGSFLNNGYEQIADKNGVRVFKHKHDGNIRLGGVGTFQHDPKTVQQVLLDYRMQRGKIERLTESRVLKRGPNSLLVYQRLNLPVISDRDFVLRVTWGEKGASRWIRFQAVRDAGPPKRSGVVRVSFHEGSWWLIPTQDGQSTRVRFQVSIDMSGWLPKWLARSQSGKEVGALFHSVQGLLEQTTARSMLCTSNCP